MWEILTNATLSSEAALLRLGLSFLAGGIIGLERERHTSPAGLRTHILICTGSTLLMLLSLHVAGPNGDPARIAAQVVSGIGFLGAGAILRYGTTVQGLTSAASIWSVAALGLAVGAGYIPAAALFLLLLLLSLITLNILEERFLPHRELKIAHLRIEGHDFEIDFYRSLFLDAGAELKSVELSYARGEDYTNLKLIMKIPSEYDLAGLADQLYQRDEVIKFRLDQVI